MSNKKFLIKKSQWLRNEIFEMVIKVNQGHIASSFSQCEIVSAKELLALQSLPLKQ